MGKKLVTTNKLNRLVKNWIRPTFAEKVNVSDIVNDFTTTVANKVADARALKTLMDEILALNRNLQETNSRLLPHAIFSGSRDIMEGGIWSDTGFAEYTSLRFTLFFQGQIHVVWIRPLGDESLVHSISVSYNSSDGAQRILFGRIKFAGRYIETADFKMSWNLNPAEALTAGNVYVMEIIGFYY